MKLRQRRGIPAVPARDAGAAVGMSDMQITVTQDDIDKGVPRKANLCPLALAIRRVCSSAFVGNGYASGFPAVAGFKDLRAMLPPAAEEFRRKFDSHEAVEPISFDLEME